MRTRLVFAACLAVISGAAGAAPWGFTDHPYNGARVQDRGAVTTFSLPAPRCSDREYEDRETSDCDHGNMRSQIVSRDTARPGEAKRYSFAMKVARPMVYDGGPNRRSALTVGAWRRAGTGQNVLYEMHLDTARGVTFGDVTCIPPSEFGAWVDVEVTIYWHRADGLLDVTCGGRQVVDRQNIDTIVPAECASSYTHHCDPELQEPDLPIELRLGLLHQGFGPYDARRGLSPEGRALTAPVSVSLRDIEIDALGVRRQNDQP